MTLSVKKIRDLLANVLAIPDQARSFDTDSDIATKHYGISPNFLEDLIRQGLPRRVEGGNQRFYSYDLSNISLHLGLPSIQRMAMRTWARTLQLAEGALPLHAAVRILPLFGNSVTAEPLQTLHLPLTDRDLRAIGPIKALLDEFSAYRFFMLPEHCRWDVDFIVRNRICECGGASKLMALLAHARGIEARQCFGLLLAAPFSTGHYWTEFKVDGVWTAFDPLLLGLLHATTRLNAECWPTDRSNEVALHRLCVIERYAANGTPDLGIYRDEPHLANPIVVMYGQALAVSLPTEFAPRPATTANQGVAPGLSHEHGG